MLVRAAFLFAYLTLPIQLFAQRDSTRTEPDLVGETLASIFQNVDKSQVPTGYLEQYASPLLEFGPFNGTLLDSNKISITPWRFLYVGMQAARIYGPAQMTPLPDVNTLIDNHTIGNTIPISLLHFNYATIRPDAVAANLLTVSGNQLFDVPGRAQSPYQQRTLFAAAPALDSVLSGNLQFVLRPELYFSNSGKTLSGLFIDGGNGNGYLPVSWSNPVAFSYPTAGWKTIRVKVTYTDGTMYESHASFKVRQATSGGDLLPRYAGAADLVQHFAANAGHSGGTVYVKFSSRNTQRRIIRPLIIVEGYDVSAVAPSQQDNFSYENFINNNTSLGLRLNTGQTFNDALDETGQYDLIFLDYRNGTDDIVRNAALLQQVIAWVNSQKQGTQQNVVLGISMGGLVARYGLAKMEKERRVNPTPGNDHQTRLLITQDSPHRGANLPLGIQALSAHLADMPVLGFGLVRLHDVIKPLREAKRLAREPATQQLLLTRAESNNRGDVTLYTNAFLDSDYRNTITFPDDAPAPYRFVATSLGSQCGKGNGISPLERLISTNGEFFIPGLPLGFVFRAGIAVDAYANALPAAGSHGQVSFFRLYREIRILSFIRIRVTQYQRSLSLTNHSLFWDGAPGGTQNLTSYTGGVPNINLPYLVKFGLRLNTSVSANSRFCFIPTVSALDMAVMNSATLSSVYSGGIAFPANVSRAANFIASEAITYQNGASRTNQAHPGFTSRQASWIFSEMQGINNNINCATECPINAEGLTIIPADPVCASGVTYSVSGLPAGTPVRWSSSDAALLTFTNPNSGQATVGTGSGLVTITAVFGICNNSIVRQIWVGRPIVSFARGTAESESCDIKFHYVPFTFSVPPNSSIDIQFLWPKVTYNRQNGNTFTFNFAKNYSGAFSIYATVTNSCGSFFYESEGEHFISRCSSINLRNSSSNSLDDSSYYKIYPNPSNDIVNIDLRDQNDQPAKEETIWGELLDMMGQSKTKIKISDNQATFSVRALKKGIYVLKIYKADQVESHQIAVE